MSGAAADPFAAALLARLPGERRPVGANNAFDADGAGRAWLVLRGRLDLLLVPMRHGIPVATGRHLLTIDPGGVLFGMEPLPLDGEGTMLVPRAVAAMDGELYEASRASLERDDFDLHAVDWIDDWVARLTHAVAGARAMPPHQPVEADPGQAMAAGDSITAPHGTVLWVRVAEGPARLFGTVPAGGDAVPLTERGWLSAEGPVRFDAALTPTALVQGFLWPSLDAFHRGILPVLAAGRAEALAAQGARVERRAGLDRQGHARALGLIGAVLAGRRAPPAEAGDTPAMLAARLVADALGATLTPPPAERAGQDRVAEWFRRSALQTRPVTLAGRWWRTDPGPLLGCWAASGESVALLPDGPGRMIAVDPADGRRRVVDAALAAALAPEATMAHRPLPPGRVTLRDLADLATHGLGPDLRRVGAIGMAAGLLGLAGPLVISHLFGEALPRGDGGTAVALVVALVFAALGAASFQAVQGIGMLRVQARIDLSLNAALWDRLLRLPPGVLRGFTAGDLVDRASAVTTIREVLSSTVTQAVLGGMVSLLSLAQLFFFSWRLALVAAALVALLVCVTLFTIWRQFPHLIAMLAAQGRVEGTVIQLIGGVPKLRVAAAERRAFARWAGLFAEQQRRNWVVRRWQAALTSFSTAFPVLSGGVLFLVAGLLAAGPDAAGTAGPAAGGLPGGLAPAAFAAFYAAFGQFAAALGALAGSAGALATIPPLLERLRPLLDAATEPLAGASDPGLLTGALELRHVTFGYGASARPVIHDLSLSVRPGEFLAVVGESGSGKSTLIRLLLGFERPDSGGIAFDGRDLAGMDLAALRRQVGVVLQDGKLMPGSLLENIVAGTSLGEAKAWDAIRRAGFEEDVRAMPMGIHTVVAPGGANLSGGQRQRLLIARALARDPRIIIFDEATSALDNPTQAAVNESLERLNVTRIVVAHRLTTIAGAHRILVLDGGRVVEEGRFEELLARGGRFAAMARRQMA